jgi:hypothetical protein
VLLVYAHLESNQIPRRFTDDAKVVDMNCIGRQKTSLRAPEATSTGRVTGLNLVQSDNFLKLVKEFRNKYFASQSIYNLD